jgi:putative transposase
MKRVVKTKRPRKVSIDPGNRTFATCYSPDTGIWKLGDQDGRKLIKLCLRADKLKSLSTKCSHRRRRNMLKAIERLKSRCKNLRREFHNKCISWLTSNFTTIILPKFNTHIMARRKNRKIHKSVVRGLLTWAHGEFRAKLSQVCDYKNITLLHPSEAYTSKTCSTCGWIDEKLGGKEIFKCKNCMRNIDRDVNGARGIYLRAPAPFCLGKMALLDGAFTIS